VSASVRFATTVSHALGAVKSLLASSRLAYLMTKAALLVFPILIFIATIVTGFILWNKALARLSDFGSNGNVDNLVNFADTSFNVSAVALSIRIATPIYLWQRKLWHGETIFRRRNSA
jgi:hypothetical protein